MRSSSERSRASGRPVSGLRGGDDLVAGRAQPPGGAAQHRRAGAAVAQRGVGEGLLRGGDGGLDVGGRGLVVRGARQAGPGVDGIEGRRHAVYSTGSVTEPVATSTGSGDRGPGPLSRARAARCPRCTSRSATSGSPSGSPAEIRAGRLAPGDRLPGERELARRLEVGRASVREAIGALQVRGVLATRPGAGSYVAANALELLGDLRPTHDAGPVRPAGGPAAARARRRRPRRPPRPPRRGGRGAPRRDGPGRRRGGPHRAGTTATAASTAASPPSRATPSCSASPTRSPR